LATKNALINIRSSVALD